MTKFIAFVSGKGGVGKTTAAVNVGQALIDKGKKMILLDGNIVTPNVAIHLGLINPNGTINKFIRKEKSLKEVIYLHESGMSIIPASPSYTEFQKTNPQRLFKIFENLDEMTDFVLIDSPSGLGYELNQILKNSDESIIVVNPTLSSVMDALKTIQLSKEHGCTVAGIILNKTHYGFHELTEKEVYEILNLPILANVKQNRKIRKSIHRQTPLIYLYPRSRIAREFRKVADYLCLD